MVESTIKIVYQRVFAPLRNSLFLSIEELNQAIRGNLPLSRYELKEFRSLKVPSNYHIELREDNHFYSIPWQLRGKRIMLVYTQSTVEVYHQNMRVAFHQRERKRGYTTLKEHMPPQHRFYAELSPEEVVSQGGKIGEEVKVLIEKILRYSSTRQRHQALRSCLGIIDLSRHYDKERLNRACRRALEFHVFSYKAVRNILEKGLDRLKEEPLSSKSYPVHSNIRGGSYFK